MGTKYFSKMDMAVSFLIPSYSILVVIRLSLTAISLAFSAFSSTRLSTWSPTCRSSSKDYFPFVNAEDWNTCARLDNPPCKHTTYICKLLMLYFLIYSKTLSQFCDPWYYVLPPLLARIAFTATEYWLNYQHDWSVYVFNGI